MKADDINPPNFLINHYRKNVTDDNCRERRRAAEIFEIIRKWLEHSSVPDTISERTRIRVSFTLEDAAKTKEYCLSICPERNPAQGKRPYVATSLFYPWNQESSLSISIAASSPL